MSNRTFKSVIKNGKRFNLLALPTTKFFKFEIVNNYGANIEKIVETKTGKNVYGISHFIEHLSFKTSKDYTTNEILDIKRNEGISNAGTSFDKIVYYLETTMEKCDTAIKLVSNIALNDLKKVTQEEFDTEKKVVFNEAKRYHDDDQTMFYFNSISAVMGHKDGDTVIGYPKTIETFTLEDTIEIKNIFLNHDDYIYNITYDSDLISQEDLLHKVENELSRFKTDKNNTLQISNKEYTKSLTSPRMEKIAIKNESEQAMTLITIDKVDNKIVSKAVCSYFTQMADETSLNHLIREKNGLTYGLNLSPSILSYKPYITFSCDVTKGTEEKMEKLFKESIKSSCENWTKEKHKKFMKALLLKRTMHLLNQKSYNSWFSIADQQPEIIEEYKDILATNINDVYSILDKELLTFENMQKNMHQINEAVQNNQYGKVTNIQEEV
jgi:predicted Zn-dependent peptidase